MAKGKKQNKSLSLIKSLKLLLSSVKILYIMLILAVAQICNLLLKNDNITLFLFIIISAIIYTIDQNMIMVLGIPLVITSVLLLLKNIFLPKMNEGFDDMEKFDKADFLEWCTNYFKNDNTYLEYTENINDRGSLKDAVTKLLSIDEDVEDDTKITPFLNYMLEIYSMKKSDEKYNIEQVIYVRGIIKLYINEKEELTEIENSEEEENVEKSEKLQQIEKNEVMEEAKEEIKDDELFNEQEQNENVETFIGKYKLF